MYPCRAQPYDPIPVYTNHYADFISQQREPSLEPAKRVLSGASKESPLWSQQRESSLESAKRALSGASKESPLWSQQRESSLEPAKRVLSGEFHDRLWYIYISAGRSYTGRDTEVFFNSA